MLRAGEMQGHRIAAKGPNDGGKILHNVVQPVGDGRVLFFGHILSLSCVEKMRGEICSMKHVTENVTLQYPRSFAARQGSVVAGRLWAQPKAGQPPHSPGEAPEALSRETT